MSEFLDMVEAGILCSSCGTAVENPVGYARECDECVKSFKKKKRKTKVIKINQK